MAIASAHVHMDALELESAVRQGECLRAIAPVPTQRLMPLLLCGMFFAR
jgi:hypothetical protein